MAAETDGVRSQDGAFITARRQADHLRLGIAGSPPMPSQ
jgi:hypothetical protein